MSNKLFPLKFLKVLLIKEEEERNLFDIFDQKLAFDAL